MKKKWKSRYNFDRAIETMFDAQTGAVLKKWIYFNIFKNTKSKA